MILIAIGVPILVIVGYIHFKKSEAFKAEADINIEANPHFRRILINTELLLPSYLKMIELMTKLANNEKLTKEEVDEISKLKQELSEHIKNRVIK